MKTLLIGGGIISDGLLKALGDSDVGRIRLREVAAGDRNKLKLILDRCGVADLIIYAAYHHANLLLNIRVMHQVLRKLRRAGWKGRFVFLNTQAVLPDVLVSHLPLASPTWRCDLYSLTKRIQSGMLEKYTDALNISEIYLPVVIGEGTRWQERLQYIARHQRVALPSSGENTFAYLDMQVFIRWLLSTAAIPKRGETKSQLRRRMFVYEGVETFRGVLARLRRQLTVDALVIDDCHYSHSYGSGTKENLVWWLKLSVLGCALFGARGLMRNRGPILDTETRSSNQGELINAEFKPAGPEYRFFGMSIDMNRIKIPVEKIG